MYATCSTCGVNDPVGSRLSNDITGVGQWLINVFCIFERAFSDRGRRPRGANQRLWRAVIARKRDCPGGVDGT